MSHELQGSQVLIAREEEGVFGAVREWRAMQTEAGRRRRARNVRRACHAGSVITMRENPCKSLICARMRVERTQVALRHDNNPAVRRSQDGKWRQTARGPRRPPSQIRRARGSRLRQTLFVVLPPSGPMLTLAKNLDRDGLARIRYGKLGVVDFVRRCLSSYRSAAPF